MSGMSIESFVWVLHLLIAPVALIIALISLDSYRKFRNWRLLFLSVAFLLLSIPPLIDLVRYSGALSGLSDWIDSELYYVSLIFSLFSGVPFALLAYVYMDERKKQSIEITRGQWIAGGFLILAEAAFVLSGLGSYIGAIDPYSGPSSLGVMFLVLFVTGSISYVLIILAVISLFSYYRAKGTRNTLLVMIGFFCLLMSHGYGVLGYLIHTIPGQDQDLGGGLVALIELGGYIAFLVALLRLRIYR